MVWTAVPVLVLVIIAIPSFKLLYYMDVEPETELTIKATGHQWYWNYTYPDNGNFTFDANMIADSDLQAGQLRLLETDNRLVVPVGTNVRIQTTAADVLHSWAVPQFGVKVDAVPGRLNQLWINVEQPGVYYGQCSELCGVNHGFMPITVEAMTRPDFDAWVAEAQTKFARADEDDRARSPAPPPRRQPAQLRDSRHHGLQHHRRQHDAHTPDRLAALAVLDQSQGHRHPLSLLRVLRRHHRHAHVGGVPGRADGSGRPDPRRRLPHVQCADHRPRPDHGVLLRHAGPDRRLRQLDGAA